MISEEITTLLADYFGAEFIQHTSEDTWQVETPTLKLLLILADEGSWLRLLAPIAPLDMAQAYLEQFLEANFDTTLAVRYALAQEVLWAVYQHSLTTLTPQDLTEAIAQAIQLQQTGMEEAFNQLVEQRLRQIIQAAKLQGQSKQATMQTLKRFYEEGMLGGLQQDSQEREQFLSAWEYQLDRLWNEPD